MDTRNPMLASPSMRVVLGLGVLMSYEGMGTGTLECTRGCHCAATPLDCHWQNPTSIKARRQRSRGLRARRVPVRPVKQTVTPVCAAQRSAGQQLRTRVCSSCSTAPLQGAC